MGECGKSPPGERIPARKFSYRELSIFFRFFGLGEGRREKNSLERGDSVGSGVYVASGLLGQNRKVSVGCVFRRDSGPR